MQIKVYRDEEGNPRVKVPGPYKILASFLEEEIQSDNIFGKEIIQIIDEIKRGDRQDWEETGNANTLILALKKVKIDSLFLETSCELSIDDFRQAIKDWVEFQKSSE